MKAIIFNSGIGKRMGEFTRNNHKSMARLANGETIFERQLRILSECGIRDFVITTGPFEQQLKDAAMQPRFADLHISFVRNPLFDQTNYIYSMHLARALFDDDALLLHGDLVFNRALVQTMLADKRADLALTDRTKPLPEKDFKVRLSNDRLSEVSVRIFGDDCFAFQPLYKLSRSVLNQWAQRVAEHIDAGDDQVYAENALNKIADRLDIHMLSYENHYIDEVDTQEDLERVSEEIRQYDFDEQCFFSDYQCISGILAQSGAKRPMLVCDAVFDKLFISRYFDELDIDFVRFSGFSSNPLYEEVAAGVKLFADSGCDFIVSVGGGSAIDTAKNIKLFSVLDDKESYIDQAFVYSSVRHLALPTTAGTGSESTRFSVLYYNGEKQSIAHDCIVPEYVILEPRLLETLPAYQKKATMMDALCQCIEAIWSVNTNDKCRGYAQQGIRLILMHIDGYLNGNAKSSAAMMQAANLGGRAINISQTTAAHAMSYKLTSLYGTAHGHAAALCLSPVWRHMIERYRSSDMAAHIKTAFDIISEAFGTKDISRALARFDALIDKLGLQTPALKSEADIDTLTVSVNPVRLKNNPLTLNEDVIRGLYRALFGLNHKL